MSKEEKPKVDPRSDLPTWAVWLRKQLNGIVLLLGGVTAALVAWNAFGGSFPDFGGENDCKNPKTQAEWKTCADR